MAQTKLILDNIPVCLVHKSRVRLLFDSGAKYLDSHTLDLSVLSTSLNGVLWPVPQRTHNTCAVCGTTKDIQTHHVIPQEFLRHLPYKTKLGILQIVDLCNKHHGTYEREANKFKLELEKSLGIETDDFMDTRLMHAKQCAGALLRHRNQLSLSRLGCCTSDLSDYLSRYDFGTEDLEEIMLKVHHARGSKDRAWHILNQFKDLSKFALLWQIHFVEWYLAKKRKMLDKSRRCVV